MNTQPTTRLTVPTSAWLALLAVPLLGLALTAVPAAAQYLARLEQRYGGRDWAVWAYHCGEGCASEVRGIAERSDGIREPLTVPKVFFGANPARNRNPTSLAHVNQTGGGWEHAPWPSPFAPFCAPQRSSF